MARSDTRYVCQSCGAVYPKWAGRCEACEAWNSLVEEAAPKPIPKGLSGGGTGGRALGLVGLDDEFEAPPRLNAGLAELNRVLGGGIVPGSAVLIGGDPGIGKSTLLLQAAAALARAGHSVAYLSGEESVDQIRLRAARLRVAGTPVRLATATSVRDLLATLDVPDAPDVVIVDSIQTVYVDSLESAPRTVAQLRASAHELIRFAKRRGAALFLVGHVTKEGQIAGPRVLEHMVDAVLYLEGDRYHQYRILRAVKNRFGSTDEVGVFEMADTGLREVRNPSEAFLEERSGNAAGATVAVTMEGTRPILVEIQALTTSTAFGLPRRSANGLDSNRLQLLVAVLQKRVGLGLGGQDIYANVVGGLRIAEPAADLAVAIAVASSFKDRPVDPGTVAVGEIGLSGELRSVNQLDRRLNEAGRLGFSRVVVPAAAGRRGERAVAGIEVVRVGTVGEAIEAVLG